VQATCDVALLAARLAGCSAALFGQAWLYENFDGSPEDSDARSDAFWGRVAEVCGQGWVV